MDLRSLIDTHLDLARLSKDLDELGHPGRLWAVHHWTRADMATLWEAAKGLRPVTLDDYVPPGVGPLVEVIHDGKNSLPLFTHFQKRFCKPADPGTKDAAYGYNHQSMSAFTGPGYFVMHPSTEPGEMDIDYTMVPKEKVTAWPPIVNNGGLGRFVYRGMVDVMRGIATHVSIGRARKSQGWMDNWFVLVREDPRADAQSSP